MDVQQLFDRLKAGLPFEPVVIDGALFRMDPEQPDLLTVQAADPRCDVPPRWLMPAEVSSPEHLTIAIRQCRFATQHRPQTLEELFPFLQSDEPFMAELGGMLFSDFLVDAEEAAQHPELQLEADERMLNIQMADEASYSAPLRRIRTVEDLRACVANLIRFVEETMSDEDDEGDTDLWITEDEP